MMYDNQSRLLRYRHPLIALLLTLLLLFLHSSYTVKISSAQHLVTQQVTITKHGFFPYQLTCNQGDMVSLTVTNSESATHHVDLSSLGVSPLSLAPGQSTTLTFAANRQGLFTFESALDGHPEVNLRGLFTVK